MHPQRPTLVEQVRRELKEGIQARRWAEWLPQERQLAVEMNVSRSTLRMALQRLRADDRLQGIRGQGNRIIACRVEERGVPAGGSRAVNAILPHPPGPFPPEPPLWVEQLRGQLVALGMTLRVIHSRACYLGRPQRALDNLLRRYPADCWLVRLAPQPLQEILEERRIPAVLVGRTGAGITLPAVDVDHRALMNHALGWMTAAGHRRIALLAGGDIGIGGQGLERDFLGAADANHRRLQLSVMVARCDGSVDALVRQIDGFLRIRNRPTAVLVAHAVHCLTLWSHLGSRGLRIPGDLSVIAHVGGPDLAYLRPEPAHYRLNAAAFVQRILRAIQTRIAGGTALGEDPILPDFVRGASLGPPPAEMFAETTADQDARFDASVMAVA